MTRTVRLASLLRWLIVAMHPALVVSTGIVAYAYLRASIPFTLPYFENREALVFTDSLGRKTPVSSFGLRPEARSADLRLRSQVAVLYRSQDDQTRQPTEFALDLCRDSKPNQVIVARLPKQETFLEMVEDLERKTATYTRQDCRFDLDLTGNLRRSKIMGVRCLLNPAGVESGFKLR